MVREDFTEEPEDRSDGVFRYVPKQRDKEIIGAVANALERKGIQTERGNINREIIKNNMLLEQAKEMLMLARQEVHSAQYAKIKSTAVSVKNEVMEMIAKVGERKGRLDLPIVSGKHLRRISDRTAL